MSASSRDQLHDGVGLAEPVTPGLFTAAILDAEVTCFGTPFQRDWRSTPHVLRVLDVNERTSLLLVSIAACMGSRLRLAETFFLALRSL